MPRHILTKLTKNKHKERILRALRKKQQVTYNGNRICFTADLSAETLQARREWQDIFKVLKGKNLYSRLQYLARISFKIDGEIKCFSDKQKWREFSTTKPALQKMLNGLYSQEIQQKRSTKSTQSIKKMAIETCISNYFKYKWIKCSNQDTDWLNGYKNKIHIYAVYKKLTTYLKTRIDWKWGDGKICSKQMGSKRKLE